MIFFRFLSGIGVVASITLFTSQLIEITDLKDRARFLAYIAAGVTLGASIGYFLGGFIAENSFTQDLFNITNKKEIFLIQSVLNLLYIGVVILLFHDRKCPLPTKNKISIFDSFKSIKNIEFKLFIFLIALAFITMGAINLNKFIDVYFNDQGLDSLQLGTFKMVTGYVTLGTSILLVPLFAKFRKQIGFMIILQILSAIIVFYTFRANDFVRTAYSIYLIYILIKAVFTPLEQNYISSHVKDGQYGKIMGVRQSFISIGMVIGPLLGGFLYERSSLLLFDSSAIAFIIGFILLAVVLILDKKDNRLSENN
ncbi:MFS transporter [Candidatus Izemoplasma sp. B36]|uniref:MFS transporter n=1 Tax=Candidatus Izemoplasma sp. B36 TaxID=3242468 RepID=UPI0035588AE9